MTDLLQPIPFRALLRLPRQRQDDAAAAAGEVYDHYTDDPNAPAEGWMVKAVCRRPACGMLDHREVISPDLRTAYAAATGQRCAWCGTGRVAVHAAWRVRVHRPVDAVAAQYGTGHGKERKHG